MMVAGLHFPKYVCWRASDSSLNPHAVSTISLPVLVIVLSVPSRLPVRLAQAVPAYRMSQANSNWSVLARDNHSHHGHHHEHYHYPTQYFCELLENAVRYIQTKHAMDEDDSFLGLPEDFLHQLKG